MSLRAAEPLRNRYGQSSLGQFLRTAAKLQAMGYEAYFYEPAAGGHGYGKDNKERASFAALGYNFLRRVIKWFD
jgi:prolyl oligopeptidase